MPIVLIRVRILYDLATERERTLKTLKRKKARRANKITLSVTKSVPAFTLYTLHSTPTQSLERSDKGIPAFNLSPLTFNLKKRLPNAKVTFEILKLPHIRENYS